VPELRSVRVGCVGCPQCQERGWLIGSGPTESLCTISVARLKACRWDPKRAEVVAALTCRENRRRSRL